MPIAIVSTLQIITPVLFSQFHERTLLRYRVHRLLSSGKRLAIASLRRIHNK